MMDLHVCYALAEHFRLMIKQQQKIILIAGFGGGIYSVVSGGGFKDSRVVVVMVVVQVYVWRLVEVLVGSFIMIVLEVVMVMTKKSWLILYLSSLIFFIPFSSFSPP